jgi:succinate dehydrogenase/fumarate reductase cytochrome b subunit
VASLQAHPVLNAIVKFGVAFPFAYHFFGGLRHLAWDNILFHNPVSARTSGLAAIAVGVVGGVAGALYESSE